MFNPPIKSAIPFLHIRVYGLLLLVGLLLPATPGQADVVKPALIEISAHKGGQVHIEIRASIEAMLTGINTDYKNTQDAPQADEYDALRVLDAPQLRQKFDAFLPSLLSSLSLSDAHQAYELNLTAAEIPPAGYTQVPRISTLTFSAQFPANATSLRFLYPERFGDHAIRVRQVDDAKEKWHWSNWEWVKKNEPIPAFSLTELFSERSAWNTFTEFTEIGFLHIIPKGLDHILFVLGLFLFSRHWRPLLAQVTMFTLAHTLTLALATLGWISLPDRVVEPLIALSIAYIGIENIWLRKNHTVARHRLVLVFAFGLLHGLGFAGVLSEFNMPEDAFLWSLISFNIGVELGQLAVILLAALAVGWIQPESRYRKWVILPASASIAAIGLFWAIERL